MVWLLILMFLLIPSLPDKQWRVLVNLSCECFGEQPCLQFEAAAIRHCIAEERMMYLFIESLFKLGEEDLALFIFEPIRPQFDHEIIKREHPSVEHSQDYRVHDDGPKFFHQIKR